MTDLPPLPLGKLMGSATINGKRIELRMHDDEAMRAYVTAAISAQAAEVEALRADAERLDWLFRQDLDDLVLQLVVDTFHDGEYCVHGDDGALGYGKTPREAIDAARAALKEQTPNVGVEPHSAAGKDLE